MRSSNLFRSTGENRYKNMHNTYPVHNDNGYQSDLLCKVKNNKDNLCNSLFEIEKFLCSANQIRKAFYAYKLFR